MDLDQELRQALRRVEPTSGLADRVRERADAPARRAARMHQWQWAAACILLCAAIGVPVHHQWRQRQAAIAARDQLLQALRLTATHLQIVKQKVKDINR